MKRHSRLVRCATFQGSGWLKLVALCRATRGGGCTRSVRARCTGRVRREVSERGARAWLIRGRGGWEPGHVGSWALALNIRLTLETLDVSKPTGWLKLTQFCRTKRKGVYDGGGEARAVVRARGHAPLRCY